MTHSTTTVAALLDTATADLGLYKMPSRETFRVYLNDCLARLFSEYIAERACLSLDGQGSEIPFSTLTGALGAPVCCEDVIAVVYEGGVSAAYLTPDAFAAVGSGAGVPTYTLTDTALRLSAGAAGATLVYTLRPKRYGEAEEGEPLPLPEEHLPLLAAYVRGEAYKSVNDDALAAKWLGEYNGRLVQLGRYLDDLRARRGGGGSV